MGIDPEILRGIKERSKENIEKRGQSGGNRDARVAPIVYTPSGTTYLRFYADSEYQLTRTFHRHKYQADSLICTVECPVCKYLGQMEKKYPGFTGHWKLSSKKITIAYAWLFSSTEDSKFVKLETPVLLMGNYKIARELDDHLADMDEEELDKMLDPLTNHAMWELKIGNNGRDFSLAPSFKKGTMNPLPSNFYPLSQCISPVGTEPTREQIARFLEVINEVYDTHIKTVDPEDLKSEKDQKSSESSKLPEKEKKEPAEKPKAAAKEITSEESSEDNPGLKECFGCHPDGIQPECVLCADEQECEDATSSKSKQ